MAKVNEFNDKNIIFLLLTLLGKTEDTAGARYFLFFF